MPIGFGLIKRENIDGWKNHGRDAGPIGANPLYGLDAYDGSNVKKAARWIGGRPPIHLHVVCYSM
jgi:hypothetical protein